MAISKITIMKFGGTSVEDAPAFERLTNIVRTVHAFKASRPVVVVSAMSGVTNALLASVELANCRRFRRRNTFARATMEAAPDRGA